MSYEMLAERIKTLPEQYLDEISDFVEYIYFKSVREQKKGNITTERLNAMCTLLRDDESQSAVNVGLESVRELVKNDSW